MKRHITIFLYVISLTVSAQTSMYTNVRSGPVMFGIQQIEKALQRKASTQSIIFQASSFISIDELIDHPTLDPRYVTIPEYVRLAVAEQSLSKDVTSPLQLADSLDGDGDRRPQDCFLV